MSPTGGGDPKGDVLKAIDRDFGGYDKFKAEFSDKAAKLFGSGWAWLAIKDGKLEIMPLKDADTPVKHGAKPLSRWMFGSTPTTSTTATCGPSSLRASGRRSTGTSPPRTWTTRRSRK